jgi:hypothetical protein
MDPLAARSVDSTPALIPIETIETTIAHVLRSHAPARVPSSRRERERERNGDKLARCQEEGLMRLGEGARRHARMRAADDDMRRRQHHTSPLPDVSIPMNQHERSAVDHGRWVGGTPA